AEAIEAYLWNHGHTASARQTVLGVVRPGESIFVDRIRRDDGESAATFDPKVDAFLLSHPELVPPPPVPGPSLPTDAYVYPGMPPIAGFVFGPTCGASAPTCGGTCPQGEQCTSNGVGACVCQACGQEGATCGADGQCCSTDCYQGTCVACRTYGAV